MMTLVPGLSKDNAIEFFELENDIKAVINGRIVDFTEVPLNIQDFLQEEIKKEPEVEAALHSLHPFSKQQRLKQYVACRFGGLDFHPDIKDGRVSSPDYKFCGIRNKCPFNGVICKSPEINGEKLTDQEIRLIKLLSTDKKNEVIADEMDIPLGTFHKIKKTLYEKAKVQTKQELTLLSFLKNFL